MTHRSIDHLLRDHRDLERVLVELELLLDSLEAKSRWTAEHALAFAWITRRFAESVMPHIAKEGEILFPALEDFLPRDTGPLAVLRGEHRDLITHFSRLREAAELLCQGSTQPLVREDFLRCGRATIQTLRDLIYKEERILFPMVARFLSGDRDAQILHKMQAMGAPFAAPAPVKSAH